MVTVYHASAEIASEFLHDYTFYSRFFPYKLPKSEYFELNIRFLFISNTAKGPVRRQAPQLAKKRSAYCAVNTITLRLRTVICRLETGSLRCSACQVSTSFLQYMEAGSSGRVTLRSSHQALEAT